MRTIAGDTVRVRPSVQPGGRPPAPGELALVQAFINTHYDLETGSGAELLSSPAALVRWLRRHRMLKYASVVDAAELEAALRLREALRELARANGSQPAGRGPGGRASPAVLNAAAHGAPVELRFGEDGPGFRLAGCGGLAAATGLLLAITARALIDGSWDRLKVCPGRHCDWTFFDHSRNQTGRWCSMSVCGGRAKARSHYRRRREQEPAR